MNTKPFSRSERVEQQVLKTINQILSKDLDLRKYGFLTFSDVKMTSDLKHANLFYSIINPTKDLKIINKELNLLVPTFRKYLSMSLELRSTPTLKFIYDDSFEQFQKINELMKFLEFYFNNGRPKEFIKYETLAQNLIIKNESFICKFIF